MPNLTASSLQTELRRLLLPMGLVIDHVVIEGAAVSVETAPFQLATGSSKIKATVAALDLAQFLTTQAPGGLKDFAISIRGGKLFVEATARVLVEVRASAVCTLRIEQGRQLFVDLESVDVMGLGAKGMVQNQLDQINPVLDVSDLPISIILDSVEADHDTVVLIGRLA